MARLQPGVVFLGVFLGGSLPAALPAMAQNAGPHAEIAASETNVNLGVGFMHTQYHENLTPGDDENGFAPGFVLGGSVLLPSALPGADLYGAFSYEFNAGNLDYGGHLLVGGAPATATDHAVFNRIEGRIGLGLPLAGGAVELIPFLAGGYQSWNRDIENKGTIGTDEFYDTGLAGGGLKLDIPLTATIVASGTGEMYGMLGGHIQVNSLGVGSGMGNSAQERISLGLDDALGGPLHVLASANWEHFNDAGTKDFYGIYEPLSTTTQVGINLGLAYSF